MSTASAEQAAQGISAERMLAHITKLASDEFEGRKPGTPGEVKTLEYLMSECKKIELGLGDCMGGYLQKMPVMGITGEPSLSFNAKGGAVSFAKNTDYVCRSGHDRESTSLKDVDVVFVGYGIVAPEYGWDDYKGVDVKGKAVLMLVGDPRRPHPEDPNRFDESFFKGKGITYYGRWTYKYETAFAKGAKAVFVVHDTERAGYKFDVVISSWGSENLFLEGDDKRTDIEGWLTHDAAVKLFQSAGQDFEGVREAAQRPEFKPVALDATLNVSVTNKIRRFITANVLAKIDGSDPKLKDECLVYCAHWDHFGKAVDEKGNVKGIFSGAVDNGAAVSAILEIARAFHALPQAPKRTIYFLFSTLEESGLLGAKFYVENPAIPLDRTLAVINLDVMNVWGRTSKFVSIAKGHSSVDEVLDRCANKQNREVLGDLYTERGCFFRSDHLEFMRKGVPAVFCMHPGSGHIGKPAEYSLKTLASYIENDYHKFSDKVKPDWDLGGLVEDAQLLFMTGLEIANGAQYPTWNAASEFKSDRHCVVTP